MEQRDTCVVGGCAPLPPPGTRLSVWSTNATAEFVQLSDVVIGADGSFSVTIGPDAVLTLSTFGGATKGRPAIPEIAALRRAEEGEASKGQKDKKVTHYMIQKELERTMAPRPIRAPGMRNVVTEEQQDAMILLKEESPNHNRRPKDVEDGVVASGIDAVSVALADVTSTGDVDMHPEKRMKAAYLAWTERQLPLLKLEMPGMRLSQYKQILFDRWKKCPENPLLQAQLAREPSV